MSNIPILPTYAAVANILKKTPTKLDASQVHGLMCGFICGTTGKNDAHWQSFIDTTGHPKTHELLQQLYETTYHQMSEFSFEFSLLLPNDTKKLTLRAEALGLWCQGFLSGLKQAHVRIEHREPNEVTEALNDLIEIAKVNYDDLLADETDETAYFEVMEYVRLAVLMLFHELKSTVQKPLGENDFLH